MTCRQISAAALLSLALALPAAAQDRVDVSKLPLNLAKIQQQLRQTSVRDESEGLNLRYVVSVYGQAPRIEIFSKEDRSTLTGPAPYGAPTHRQMIEQVTPQEYRAPAADFSSLFRWLADKAGNKK